MILNNSPRTLFLDIETAPKIAYVWQTFKTNVSVEQIVSDTHLLSFAAKWADEKKVHYFDQSHARSISNDMTLLKEIHKFLDEADFVVAHNGQAFDLPFVITRMAAMDMRPPSPYRQIDTYRIAKKQFGFTFNKLEFLAKALKCGTLKSKHKKFPGMELWKECLARNQEAWKEMKLYNIDDVLALEEVYYKLLPWIEGHPNVGMYVDSKVEVCPNCGSSVEKRGFTTTNIGTYQRYHCLNPKCGKYPRGRKNLAGKELKSKQLVS